MIDVNARKFPLVLNLQTFADEPTEPAEPKEPAEPAKTFTQDELDRIVAERIARERKKFADYDDLKTKLTAFEQAEEERKKAEMTEKERLEAEKAEAAKRAEEAEGKAQAALEAANQRLIRSEFRLMARSDEFKIRPDALDAALKLADLSAVKVDEDGNVSGVKEALEALIKSSPYLIEQAAPTKPKQIGEPSNPVADEVKTLEQQLADAKKKRDFAKVVELSNKIKKVTGQ